MKEFTTQNLLRLCRKHGFEAEKAEAVPTGKFNHTYIIWLKEPSDGRKKIVLRIAPSDKEGFIFYEKGMMKQEPSIHKTVLQRTEIPVPRIFVFDDSRRHIDSDYLIMEHMEGKALSESGMTYDKQNSIMNQIGRYLRQLHETCAADRYGYLGEHNCMEPANTWRNAFETMWNKLIDDIRGCGVYRKQEEILARKALDRNIAFFKREVPASLLHMDIWSQNILVNENGIITAIVDWDRGLWGDPEIEFAVLEYTGFNNDAFWHGYGKRPLRDEAYNIRRVFYYLYEVQKYLVIWTLRGGDTLRIPTQKQYSLNLLEKAL